MALGRLALAGRAYAQDKPAKSGEVITVNAIHQEEDFAASPQRICEVRLDVRPFTDFSGGR
jgi:hypothetical protein